MAPADKPTSLTSVPVQVSPKANGQIVRYSLIIEAAANILAAAAGTYYAKDAAAGLTAPASHSLRDRAKATVGASGVTPFAVEVLCGIIAASTVQVILCIPNTKRGIESRPTMFATFLTLELFLLIQLAFEAYTGHSGLNSNVCWSGVTMVAPLAFWRVWVLWIRPDWMGSYREAPVKRA